MLTGIISSLGAGFFPAIQALAIDIYTNLRPENRSEVGKLFGALGVTQVLAYVFFVRLTCWLTMLHFPRL